MVKKTSKTPRSSDGSSESQKYEAFKMSGGGWRDKSEAKRERHRKFVNHSQMCTSDL